MLPWSISSVPNRVVGLFTFDYISSQVMANWLAYCYSQGNRRYFFGWQLGPIIGLSLITALRFYKQSPTQPLSAAGSLPTQRKQSESITENTAEFLFKTIPLGVLLSIFLQSTINDMLEISGIAKPNENTFGLYRDLLIHWGLQAKVNFVTSISACNPDFERMDWSELWGFILNLVVKPYCLYGVVIMAKFFRKWFKSTEPKHSEGIERAKKYILEDFLEEHHVSMSDMSKKETETMFNECMELFAKCYWDYDLYKEEKSKLKKAKPDEHLEFMNDIKKLKEQINEVRERKDKKFTQTKDNAESDKEKNQQDIDNNINNYEKEDKIEKDEEDDAHHSATTNKSKPSLNGKKSSASKTSKPKPSNSKSATSFVTRASRMDSEEDDDNTCNYRSFHYLYSFLQMAVFTFLGLSIRKLFFLCFTQGCVLGSTISSSLMSRKNRRIFWTAYLSVFLTSIVNPGIRVSNRTAIANEISQQ